MKIGIIDRTGSIKPLDPEVQEQIEESLRKSPMIRDITSATQLREMRRRVQHTCSLISTQGPIIEQPSSLWAAELENRKIFWRPVQPFPPYAVLNEDEVLYLCAHEASHLNYSGRYDVPNSEFLNEEDKGRFHRFVNAVEDIRCDRLSAQEFPGFEPLRLATNTKIHAEHLKMSPEEWHPIDQVGMNLLNIDSSLPTYGDPEAQRIAQEAWPQIDRVANSASTHDVAQGVLDLYKRLRDVQPPQPGGGEGEGEDEGDSAGQQGGGGSGDLSGVSGKDLDTKGTEADSPTGTPVRSEGEGGGGMTHGEQLQGMADDAQGQNARQALKDAVNDGRHAQNRSENAEQTMTGDTSSKPGGQPPGTERGSSGQSDDWDRIREQMRGDINTLAGRLRAVLRHNAQENYVDGKRRGRLNPRRAYRASAGNVKIFRKREQMGSLDYTFGLIVDRSGSMSGREIQAAGDSVVMFVEALEKVGLPNFVVPWDTLPQHVKPIDQRVGPHKRTLGYLVTHADGGTYEAPALVIAEEQFARVRSGHKLLFVISDGDTSNIPESQQLARELEEDLGVRVVAVGIGFEPPRHYHNRLRVGSASELREVLPRYINEMVKRGGR